MYYYWQYLYERNVFFSYENGTTGIKNLDINGILENEEIEYSDLIDTIVIDKSIKKDILKLLKKKNRRLPTGPARFPRRRRRRSGGTSPPAARAGTPCSFPPPGWR